MESPFKKFMKTIGLFIILALVSFVGFKYARDDYLQISQFLSAAHLTAAVSLPSFSRLK